MENRIGSRADRQLRSHNLNTETQKSSTRMIAVAVVGGFFLAQASERVRKSEAALIRGAIRRLHELSDREVPLDHVPVASAPESPSVESPADNGGFVAPSVPVLDIDFPVRVRTEVAEEKVEPILAELGAKRSFPRSAIDRAKSRARDLRLVDEWMPQVGLVGKGPRESKEVLGALRTLDGGDRNRVLDLIKVSTSKARSQYDKDIFNTIFFFKGSSTRRLVREFIVNLALQKESQGVWSAMEQARAKITNPNDPCIEVLEHLAGDRIIQIEMEIEKSDNDR